MKLFYVANIRIPTEKAHGVAIVKACEAFARAGVDTSLIVPRRRTPYEKDVYETYGVERTFSIKFLPTLDRISPNAGMFIFWLQTVTFQWSLFFFLFFKDRKTIIYTRDPAFIPLRALGFQVVFECHLIPKRRAAFFSLAQRASRIIVISRALKDAFVAKGFASKNILVAPSGVDLSIFDIAMSKETARKKLELPQNRYIAVYTGNFTTMGEDKGIGDILKALVDAPHVLFVAAGGSEKDIARYTKQAEELGVAQRVIFHGSTSQKQLAVYQKAADILLMPFPDTPHYRKHMSPVKMFEYMAAKRPIIASDLPTIREVLHEQNAIIVPPGEPKALAKALSDIEPVNADASAEKAYSDAQQYSWKTRTDRVLRHILGEKKGI